MMVDNPLLSISCTTYNHAPFIRKCLDGFLLQKTNFKFEVIIHDDASSDGTADIIREYQLKYGDIIKPIYQKENKYSKGIKPTFKYNFPRFKGKYIAICEGDDYWTDPFKLQKQVDFLEANPDFGLCFTRASCMEKGELKLHELPDIKEDGVYTLIDLYSKYNFIATGTIVFPIFNVPEWLDKLPFGDLGLYSIVAKDKKIKCLDIVSAVYRLHDRGAWQGVSRDKQVLMYLDFYKKIYVHVNSEIQKVIKLKLIVSMEELCSLKYKNNRIARGLYYRYLKYKYYSPL